MRKYIRTYLDSFRGLSTATWMLAVVMLINRTGAMVLPFLGIYLKEGLGFSLKETGFVLSCYGLGSMTGSLLGGWLTDKYGHFRVQVNSLFLAVPFFVLLSFLNSMLTLSIGVFILSTVVETFRPANSVSISYHATPEQLTRSFSLNRMALNLGFSMGPAFGGFLAAISYHLLFYGNAFSVLVAALVLYLYFHKKEYKSANEPRPAKLHSEQLSSAGGISPWRDWDFVIFNIFVALFSLSFFQLLNTMPMFYQDSFSMSNQEMGILIGFNGVVVFALEMIMVSFLERKMTISNTIVLGTILCGISYLILAFAQSKSMLYVSMFIFSFSEIFVMPFLATIVINRSGEQSRGAYMGANSFSFSSSFIFAPLAGTMLAQQFGYRTLWIIIFVILILTSIGLKWNLRKMEADSAQERNLKNLEKMTT